MKYALSLLIAFAVGAGCRYFGLPAPGPPKLLGVLLVVAITCGYVAVDTLMSKDKTEDPSAR